MLHDSTNVRKQLHRATCVHRMVRSTSRYALPALLCALALCSSACPAVAASPSADVTTVEAEAEIAQSRALQILAAQKVPCSLLANLLAATLLHTNAAAICRTSHALHGLLNHLPRSFDT